MDRGLVILLAALLASPTAAQNSPRFGSLQYPGPGNFQPDEGTIEIHVIVGFDSLDTFAKARRKQPIGKTGSPLVLAWAPPNQTTVEFAPWAAQIAMVDRFHHSEQSHVWSRKSESIPPLDWKPGEHHVIACTWRGKYREIYLDGKPGEARAVESTLAMHSVTDLTIDLGNARSRFAIDEVRISSVARTADELATAATAAPARDPYTLLLDHCDGPNAEVISGFSGETGARTHGHCETIPGKYGKALKLWSE